jgi:RNAse (barnase) inhibitor barstar
MTKEEYFALICADPWHFPNVEGHPPPPAEWAREAWELEKIQNNVVYDMAREVSKTGVIGYGARLVSIAEVLTSDQVLRLFSTIRNCSPHRESEFRTEFEAGFPEHAPFLPSPVADSPDEIWLSDGRRIRFFGFTVDGTPVRVLIDTARITDWKSFHDVFADAFGFPEYYGRNLDAFFDCLSCLDSPESGMTKIQLPPKGVVVIELSDPADLKARCPGIYSGLVKTIGEINERREDRIVGVSIYPAGWTATVEGAEGVDWPPGVDAQGREMPATGMWKIEPLPPLFNKDGSLTKTGYFALLSEDPLEFPFLPGYSPPPVEWVREAWDIEYFRDFFVRELARGVSKCGSFDLTDEVRLVLSEALTTEQVVKFFLDLRGEGEREIEFRPEFEKVFAKHAQFLPPLCMDEWIDANCPELRYWEEPLPDDFVDLPPGIDARGNEISFLATRVDEPRPFVEYKGEDCPPEPD